MNWENVKFNQGYEDCCDPYRGALVTKPASWSDKSWLDYCDGVALFNRDTRAIQNDGDHF